MSIRLLFDEGPGKGLGHRRRMEALGDALRSLGADVLLGAVDEPGPRSEVLVVDSYVHRADDRERFEAEIVVAVDDLSRNLAVAVVVDPTPGSKPSDHPGAERSLTGPTYALVDPRLADMERTAIRDDLGAVLVATGGTDAAGIGATIAGDLLPLLPGVAIRLAVGPWSANGAPEGAIVVRTRDGLADEIARADLVVTAGGVTMLESLALARPTVAMVTAENQRRYVQGAADAQAIRMATIEDAAAQAAALAADLPSRRAIARTAALLVDGRGATRVAEAVLAGR